MTDSYTCDKIEFSIMVCFISHGSGAARLTTWIIFAAEVESRREIEAGREPTSDSAKIELDDSMVDKRSR